MTASRNKAKLVEREVIHCVSELVHELVEYVDDLWPISISDNWEEPIEEYEHWIVSDWLANKLEERGEMVIRDFLGLTIWGRTSTGQAIKLDWVISKICEEMEILEGQEHEWNV